MEAPPWDPHSWRFTNDITPVNLEYLEAYAIPFDSRWLMLTIDELSGRHLEPMAHVFAGRVRSKWPPGSTMVCAIPQLPPPGMNSGGYSRMTDPNSKLSILVVRDYDILNHRDILGICMLFGLMGAYQMNWFEQEQVNVLTLERNRISTRLAELEKAA